MQDESQWTRRSQRAEQDFTKEPPNNQEAEAAVLGACLAYGQTALPVALEALVARDFYRPAHRKIFEVLGGLFIENIPVDLVTVREELQKREILDEIGGSVYLVSLKEAAVTDKNIAYHCAIVKDKSLRRKAIRIGHRLTDAGYDGQYETQELISLAGEGLFSLVRGDAERSHRTAGRLDFDDYIAKHLGEGGLSWGVPKLDEMTGGMGAGDLAILAGLEKQGKTALAMHIARHNARQGKKILFFSLEMSRFAITQRIIASETKIPSLHLKTGRLLPAEALAEAEFMASERKGLLWENFLVDDRPQDRKTFPAIVRLYSRQYPLSLIVLDYVTLFCSMDPKEVTDTVRLFKAMAKEYNLPFLALAQRNRPIKGEEARMPQANDLLVGGERDCDFLLFVFNPASHLFDQPITVLDFKQQKLVEEWEKKVRVILKYDRQGGGKGSVDLVFDRNCGWFGEVENREREEPSF